MYGCSPTWSADWISEKDLRATLEQLARTIEPSPYGPTMIGLSHGLHFTGGEPFMNFDLLCRATEIAAELRIPSLFVETNGYWASDDHEARERLTALKERGLAGMMVSVNPFYLEYVPFERTERAARIGHEVFGPNLAVYQMEYFRQFAQMGIRGRMPFEEYLKRRPAEWFGRDAEFFFMGRAPYSIEKHLGGVYPRQTARKFFSRPCTPPFARQWHNHFDNYGNYMPGFCGGITFGDCRALNVLLKNGIETDDHPILGFLLQGDFKGLYEFAWERGYNERKDGYFSKCHLCLDLRKHLVETGDFAELKPREFYEHVG